MGNFSLEVTCNFFRKTMHSLKNTCWGHCWSPSTFAKDSSRLWFSVPCVCFWLGWWWIRKHARDLWLIKKFVFIYMNTIEAYIITAIPYVILYTYFTFFSTPSFSFHYLINTYRTHLYLFFLYLFISLSLSCILIFYGVKLFLFSQFLFLSDSRS